MKNILFITLSGVASIQGLTAASTQVNLFSPPAGPSFEIVDNTGTVLTAGTAADGDGAIMQLGYYTGGGADTATHVGTWTPIAGKSSSNDGLNITIGDGGVGDGTYSTSVEFDDGVHAGLPATGTQLAIRFYNDTTVAGSTHYNTVTSPTWDLGAFATPSPTPVTFAIFDTLVWEDSGNTFKTSIEIVPEPSSAALVGLGGLALLLRRRR